MSNIIDNTELDEILTILESMEDELLAAQLLKDFNDASKDHGQLILNIDQSLTHSEWKKKCDEAKERVDFIVEKIRASK